MKLAAMEAMWHTEPAPAGFNLFAIPGDKENSFEVQVPYALGLIATRSLSGEVPGILDLVQTAGQRIRNGQIAYAAMEAVRANPSDTKARETFAATWKDLGYALLLKRYREDVVNATPEEITEAAFDTVPGVAPLFWSFRLMVVIGFYLIAFFATAFWRASKHRIGDVRALLWIALLSLPTPWIAIEAGWFIAEYGRQPWVVEGVLPTFYAASGLTLTDLSISLAFFLTLYTTLAVVMVFLMLKTVKAGPKAAADWIDGAGGSRFVPEGAVASPDHR